MEALHKSEQIPPRIKEVFRRADSPLRVGEIMLWREVTARMTMDAFGATIACCNLYDGMPLDALRTYCVTVSEAREWFATVDAEDVFDMAGFHFAPVKEHVVALPPIPLCQTKPNINVERFLNRVEIKSGTRRHIQVPEALRGLPLRVE